MKKELQLFITGTLMKTFSHKYRLILLMVTQITMGSLTAQQYNWWQFGNKASINFNTNPATVGTTTINSSEASASISDATGNLLFYTDGVKVYKSNGTIMPNSANSTTYVMAGNSSSSQTIIIPKPGSSTLYYVFSVPINGAGKIKYSTVDLGSTGTGTVTNINTAMPDPSGFSANDTEKMTATKHCNGTDYWLITHEFNNNKFKVFPITSAGVGNPVISNQGIVNSGTNFGVPFKMSPNGRLFACTNHTTTPEIFNFDSNYGTIGLNKTLNSISGGGSLYAYGLEFSPNGRYLYYGCNGSVNGIYRYDTYNPNNATVNITAGTTFSGDGMQIAPDGNIYIVNYNQNFLSKIANPNTGGTYVQNALTLVPGTNCINSLPNFPNSANHLCSTASFTFTNPGQTVINEDSHYGPLPVTQLCQTLPTTCLTINGSASQNETAYFIEVAQFDAQNWVTSTPMYSNWVSATEVPLTDINLCNLPGVSFQPNTLYVVRLAVGPEWNSVDHWIRINPLPTINAGPDVTVCNGSTASLTVTASNWPVRLYRPHGLFTDVTSSPVNVTPSSTTSYTLTTTNSFGCKASDVAVVTVSNCPTPCFAFNNVNQTVGNEDSYYGPQPVTSICLPNVIIDGDCSTNETGYFIGISEFDLVAWQDIGPVFYQGWVSTTAQVTNSINLSALAGTTSSNTPSGPHTFQVNHVYRVGLAVSPPWASTQKFFRVKSCNTRTGEFELEETGNDLTDNTLNIYPNPASGIINLESNDLNIQKVMIYDVIGQKISEHSAGESKTVLSIDLSKEKAGIYFMKIESNDKVLLKKFIKE